MAVQYVYTMQGLTKVYPGGKKVFENIHLSFLPENFKRAASLPGAFARADAHHGLVIWTVTPRPSFSA